MQFAFLLFLLPLAVFVAGGYFLYLFTKSNRKLLLDAERDTLKQLRLSWWVFPGAILLPNVIIFVGFRALGIRGELFSIIQPMLTALGLSAAVVYQLVRIRGLDLPKKFLKRQTVALLLLILLILMPFGLLSLSNYIDWREDDRPLIIYASDDYENS